jgi:hypothetical protein
MGPEAAPVSITELVSSWFRSLFETVLAALAMIIGLALTAVALLIIVAVVKWAYVEVFYR